MLSQQLLNQRTNAGIIRCGKANHTQFVIASGRQGCGRLLAQNLRRFFPHRPVNDTSLAKTATSITAAHHLNHSAVMHNLGKRHNLLLRKRRSVHLSHNPLTHPSRRTLQQLNFLQTPGLVPNRLIKLRHVNALNLASTAQKILPAQALRPAGGVKIQQLRLDILALADDKQIKKIRQWLRVVSARAAGHHQRPTPITLRPLCREQRQTG